MRMKFEMYLSSNFCPPLASPFCKIIIYRIPLLILETSLSVRVPAHHSFQLFPNKEVDKGNANAETSDKIRNFEGIRVLLPKC